MKKLNVIKSVLLSGSAALLLLTSCEGPAGPAGEDGSQTCLQCHESNQIIEKSYEFAKSAHKGGLIAVDYAGGRGSCAECHSHEGFLEFEATGDVVGDIVAPSAWECGTCHRLHTEFDTSDYMLRLSESVTLIADNNITVDYGSSNVCANCHQSRRAEPNVTNPGTTFNITSTHYGPHHGAQVNVMHGATFAEIPGSIAYPSPESHAHANVGCTGCHMGSFDNATGGHSFEPNVTNCNGCHQTPEDFDYKGSRKEIEKKLHELRDLLLAQEVIESEMDDDGNVSYHPVVGEHTMAQAQAFFNWIGLEEDRSLGVHNPDYVNALLVNSIEAISTK